MTQQKEGGTSDKDGLTANGLSRRKLLKLAAYSVPTAAILSIPGAARALAATPGPCQIAYTLCVDPNSTLPRYVGVDCSSRNSVSCTDPSLPTRCVEFTPSDNGDFQFNPCAANIPQFVPAKDVCYQLEVCQTAAGSTCWIPRECPAS